MINALIVLRRFPFTHRDRLVASLLVAISLEGLNGF
jgi:hypothetical protein